MGAHLPAVERLDVRGKRGVRRAADAWQRDHAVELDDVRVQPPGVGPRALAPPDDQHLGARDAQRRPELVVGGADVERLNRSSGEADRQLEQRVARIGVGQHGNGPPGADGERQPLGDVHHQPSDLVPGQRPPVANGAPALVDARGDRVAQRRALGVAHQHLLEHRPQRHASTGATAAEAPSAATGAATRLGRSSR